MNPSAHWKTLYAYARKLGCSKEHAEDLVQDTMIKALTNPFNSDKGAYEAWLFTILRNQYYSVWRHTSLSKKYAHLTDESEEYEAPFEEICRIGAISKKMAKMSPNQAQSLTDLI